jgi:hypothetical protein
VVEVSEPILAAAFTEKTRECEIVEGTGCLTAQGTGEDLE